MTARRRGQTQTPERANFLADESNPLPCSKVFSIALYDSIVIKITLTGL
jgi:hypothetical protein